MSPSVLFVVVLPILKEIFAITKIEKGEKIGKALLMGLGFTVSISSGMTTIAHVFPVLAIQQLSNISHNINTLTYMGFAIPTGLILFFLMYIMLFVVYKPDTSKLNNVDTSSIKESLPKTTKSDLITLIIFFIIVGLWLIPNLCKELIPEFYGFMKNLTDAAPPILGTIALCVIRVDGKPIIKIDEALKKVPWPSLIMCAATLALSSALTNEKVGLQPIITAHQGELSVFFSGVGIITAVVIFTIWALLQTNLSSNMVTATLVSSIAVAVLSVIPDIPIATIVCIIGFAASLAFATPPSMPHIAIVGGDEYGGTKETLLFGSILMICSFIVLICVGFFLGNAIFY
jgi:sodium-dependent dicarboxylate transporter 2/3/5